jgi:hypothetical protein
MKEFNWLLRLDRGSQNIPAFWKRDLEIGISASVSLIDSSSSRCHGGKASVLAICDRLVGGSI